MDSYALAKKAIKAGIKYMPGELMGKKPAADKMTVYENFNLESDYENILSCANDVKPDYQEKNNDKNSFYAIFDKEKCTDCSLKSECRIKAKKKHNSISFTEKQYETGKLRKQWVKKNTLKSAIRELV